MPRFGQVLGTECETFIGLERTYLFLEERWVKNSNFVTSNVYANPPDQRRILHAGHP